MKNKIEKTIKAGIYDKGSTKQVYILSKESTSPTAALEAIITTGVIDTKYKRYVMSLDIPYAFVQTEIALDRDNIIMKIRGKLVNILLEMFPVVYDTYIR